MKEKLKFKFTPQAFIILTFLITIALGTILLCLPCATKDGKGLPFVDSWFLVTSATCVTGLSTVNLGNTLSLFGNIVVICLVEIGGLSFLTIASFIFMLLGVKVDVRAGNLMKEQLNQENSGGLRVLIFKIVTYSFIIQFIGAFASFFIFKFKYNYSFGESVGYSLFHAISSFNNAGLDIFGGNSLMEFSSDIGLNIITMLLIILGGIGFMVISDVFSKKKWRKFSLNTKIVLSMTGGLIIFGWLFFKLSMWNEMSWLEALFCSVTARTAGFATVDMANLSGPAYIIMIFLMFVGASPCSTGGGFKTTSLLVLICSLIGFAKGTTPHVFSRKISDKQISKTFALFTFEISYLVLMVLIVCFAEKYSGHDIETKSIIFETVSAFATVGLSQGITGSLSIISKIVLIQTMFVGRLGPLTIVSLWNKRKDMLKEKDIKYVEDDVLIG